MNEAFVPIALKAGIVNMAPREGMDPELLASIRIGKTAPAPQGICVCDGSGRPVAWAESFESRAKVVAFLDHCRERIQSGARETERFMKFPGAKMADVTAPDAPTPPDRHDAGKSCVAIAKKPKGTLVARLVGRALDEKGEPSSDTTSQEHYVEDRFELSASTLRDSRELAQLLGHHAFLGMLDVAPQGPVEGELVLERKPDGIHVSGHTRVAATPESRPDRATFEHAVQLDWDGLVEMDGDRPKRVLLEARGDDRLRWDAPGSDSDEPAIGHLMSGHKIDQGTHVRYGIVAEPVPESETLAPGEEPAVPQFPEPARARALHAKMEKVRAGVDAWARAGRDPAPVAKIMQGFDPLVREGRIDAAEAVLDDALALLGATEEKAPAKEDPHTALRAKLEKVHRLVGELVRDGKTAEAEAALDKLIDALSKRPEK